MNTHQVLITLSIKAESLEHAEGIAEGAAEHLLETFNDDGSLQEASSCRLAAEAVSQWRAKGTGPVAEWMQSPVGNYPMLVWHSSYIAEVGAKLYAHPPAQEQQSAISPKDCVWARNGHQVCPSAAPAQEHPNLACKSVQKRLATQWGYVPAQERPLTPPERMPQYIRDELPDELAAHRLQAWADARVAAERERCAVAAWTVTTIHAPFVKSALRAQAVAQKQGKPAYVVLGCKAQVYGRFPGVWCHRVHADGRVDCCVIEA
jgi:hypothetical protein